MNLENLLEERSVEQTDALLKGSLPYTSADLLTSERQPLSGNGKGPTRRPRRKIKGWMLAVIGVVAVIVLGYAVSSLLGGGQQASEEPQERTAVVDRGPIVVTLGVLGNLEPEAEANLAFAAQGVVAEVPVKEGDAVKAGDVLARLDSTDLDLAVAQAEQTVTLQEASLDQLLLPPDPEKVRIAQAQLEQASLSLALATEQRGSANFDLAIAQAEQAVAIQQANLDDLQSGPDPAEVQAAEAQLEQARLSLEQAQRQEDNNSLDLAVEQAEQAVAIQKANIKALKDDSIDDDDQEAQFDAAEAQLEQAKIALEQARRERDAASLDLTVEQAEQAVAIQQANLDALLSGSDPEQVQAAQAKLEQARISLEEARRNSDPAELDNAVLQAQQALAIQQATFDDLVSGPEQTEVDMAAVQLEQAKIALEQAQRKREDAFLRAPFDGVVMEINVTVGETVGAGTAVRLADIDPLHITAALDEVDIARVIESQQVQVEMDALPDLPVTGHVVHISPDATEDQGVVTYEVRIDLDPSAVPLRPGMTATADIVTMHLEDVLRVPNWAVRFDPQTGQAFVSVRRNEETAEGEGAPAPLIPLAGPSSNGSGSPGLEGAEEVEVELGERDDTYSQVLSGLQEGDVVVVSLEREVDFFGNGE
jgi:HlyD family secretion protein